MSAAAEPPHLQQRKRRAGKHVLGSVLSGTIAGGTARLLTAPFDLLKIRLQLQVRTASAMVGMSPDKLKYTGIVSGLRTVWKEEGFRGMWRGNLAATYLWVTYAGVQFGLYEHLERGLIRLFRARPNPAEDDDGQVMTPEERSARLLAAQFCAGSVAGTAAISATYPFDLMRTQFAAQAEHSVYGSVSHFARKTYQTRGVAGFYQGLSAAVVQIMPYMGLTFAIKGVIERRMEAMQRSFSGRADSDSGDSLTTRVLGAVTSAVAGGAGGGLAKLLVYPIDTVKKRLQATTMAGFVNYAPKHHYSGIGNTFQRIIAEEGALALYKGLGAQLVKSSLSSFLTFGLYRVCTDILDRAHFAI